MRRFAVAFVSFFDNSLTIEFVEAPNWQEAIPKHSQLASTQDWVSNMPWDLEAAKQYFFDSDCLFAVEEVPNA